MPIPLFSDIYKLFYYQDKPGPYEKVVNKQPEGVGITAPNFRWDIRNELMGGPSAHTPLKISLGESDYIEISNPANRIARYEEYDRLEVVPEIHMALNTFADEACLVANTPVATPFGYIPLGQLAQEKKPDDRFLVYCWDFDLNDYTLGWAFNPRYVKDAETVEVFFDNGKKHIATPDHRFLTLDNQWVHAGDLKEGQELKAFYRLPARTDLTKSRKRQFPRIFTYNQSWIHERQFIDEWKTKKKLPEYAKYGKIIYGLSRGMQSRKALMQYSGVPIRSLASVIYEQGFSMTEIKSLLHGYATNRTVVKVRPAGVQPVYDLSVESHENFCTNITVVHNCQKDDRGHICKIESSDPEVKREAEFLTYKLLEADSQENSWAIQRGLCKYGDQFIELVVHPDNPKKGIVKIKVLPVDTMHRIETIKGKVVEFQQTPKDKGPDYEALKTNILTATETDLFGTYATRFHPDQIVHLRIGDNRKTFYPHGVSVLEAARGPAHQLRMMEDAMLVYRLCLVGNTRITTDGSWKYIKDLVNGDVVYSYDSNRKLVPATIKYHVNNGPRKTYTVKSRHFEITGTATHPILVKRDDKIQYVDIKDIRPDEDKFVIPDYSEIEGKDIPLVIDYSDVTAALPDNEKAKYHRRKKYKFDKSAFLKDFAKDNKISANKLEQFFRITNKPAKLRYGAAILLCNAFKLSKESLLTFSKNEPIPKPETLPIYINEEFARLFGILLYQAYTVDDGLELRYSGNEEMDRWCFDVIAKYFGNNPRSRFFQSKNLQWKKWSKKKHKICSKTIRETLLNLDFPESEKYIPQWVFQAKPNIKRAFIDGLLESRALTSRTKTGDTVYELDFKTERIAEDVKQLWQSLGLRSTNIKHNIHSVSRLKPDKRLHTWSIHLIDKPLAKFETIKSVEYAGVKEVFDITVDNDIHNFIANGVPVHNTRAPERRVFYIDVGQFTGQRAEALVDRIKDQFKKKKSFSRRHGGSGVGASAVEEHWNPMPPIEDFFVPIRPNSSTRIDTLPAGQLLSEIDDALYFRKRVLTALNFPENYLSSQDPQASRLTLSNQDVHFARFVERLQQPQAMAWREIIVRHLRLRGFPAESYADLEVKMTPPSDWRLINRNEVTEVLFNRAATMKGSAMMSDFDIYVRILGMSEDEAREMVARNKAQKYEDMRMQAIAADPVSLGLTAAQDNQTQIGTTPEGPNPELPPDENQGQQPTPEGIEQQQPEGEPQESQPKKLAKLPEPSDEDIKKYDLEIEDFSQHLDDEEIDAGELGGDGI